MNRSTLLSRVPVRSSDQFSSSVKIGKSTLDSPRIKVYIKSKEQELLHRVNQYFKDDFTEDIISKIATKIKPTTSKEIYTKINQYQESLNQKIREKEIDAIDKEINEKFGFLSKENKLTLRISILYNLNSSFSSLFMVWVKPKLETILISKF